MTQNLTDAEIDGLSGRSLDEAVAIATGWQCRDGCWYGPAMVDFPFNQPPRKHCDLGSALSLLLGRAGGWSVSPVDDEFSVYTIPHNGEPLAVGLDCYAATVICRSYLKLKNRDGVLGTSPIDFEESLRDVDAAVDAIKG